MGSSHKGSAWERRVCKELSLWWTNGERDDIFWRSSQSGGRATQRAKSGVSTANSHGDIGCLDEIGRPFLDFFCIECKIGYSKDTDCLDVLDSKKKRTTLFKFWDQCERDRELGGMKASLIVFKRDRKLPCIIISYKVFQRLRLSFGNFGSDMIIMNHGNEVLVVVKYTDMFNWMSPEVFKVFEYGRG